jgi:protocatechuate 3,4-dioxygenase beta subunit
MLPNEPHPPTLASRRRFHAGVLATALAALGGGTATGPAQAQAQARLRPTARDFEGPYRPPKGTAWGGADLLHSRDAAAAGSPLLLVGRLLDTAGQPLGGLQVQAWQANASGRYDYHPGETPGHGRPDPAFRGHGQTESDADGWFAFRTVRPGGYKRTLFGFLPWTFVPHIHVAVRRGGSDLLVTQADLDKVAAHRPAPSHADHGRLLASDAMRSLAEAVGAAALGGDRAAIEIIRFDVVLDLAA